VKDLRLQFCLLFDIYSFIESYIQILKGKILKKKMLVEICINLIMKKNAIGITNNKMFTS
jgi:hypothetical protein